MFWDSDWDAVIGGTNGASLDSVASCTTCHNVHGSMSPVMIRSGELISTADNDKTPAFDFCYADDQGLRDCSINSAPSSTGGAMWMGSGYPEGTGSNHVCKHCHSGADTEFYIYYSRTAKDIPTQNR